MAFMNILGDFLSFNWVKPMLRKLKEMLCIPPTQSSNSQERKKTVKKYSSPARTASNSSNYPRRYNQSFDRFHEEQDDYDWMDSL